MPRTLPFNKHYMQYEEWFLENHYVYQSELHAVRHFIPSKGDGFEIGIGSGKFAEPLGLKIGVEPSKAMRKLAKKKGLKVYNATAEKLPFEDERFDYALMVTSICFVDDIDKSLREASRVLSHDGFIIIGFVDRTSRLGEIYEKNKEENVFYHMATFYSTDEIINLLHNHNFEKIEIIQTVFGKLSEVKEIQKFKEGYGDGGFIVMKATKRRQTQHSDRTNSFDGK